MVGCYARWRSLSDVLLGVYGAGRLLKRTILQMNKPDLPLHHQSVE